MRNVVHTYNGVTNTRETAMRLSIILAGDMGIASEIVKIKGGHSVVADDGKSTDFLEGV